MELCIGRLHARGRTYAKGLDHEIKESDTARPQNHFWFNFVWRICIKHLICHTCYESYLTRKDS